MGVMQIPGHTHQKPREVTLDEIRAVLGDCRLCQLCQTRTKIVFGTGNPHARVMFVGEAPGRNEDLQGEPFVGAAGEDLNGILSLAGLTREEVYVVLREIAIHVQKKCLPARRFCASRSEASGRTLSLRWEILRRILSLRPR